MQQSASTRRSSIRNQKIHQEEEPNEVTRLVGEKRVFVSFVA